MSEGTLLFVLLLVFVCVIIFALGYMVLTYAPLDLTPSGIIAIVYASVLARGYER